MLPLPSPWIAVLSVAGSVLRVKPMRQPPDSDYAPGIGPNAIGISGNAKRCPSECRC
jgi:hypothetical protein